MMRLLHALLFVASLMIPATAQDAARNFPMGKSFKVVSISGFDVQKASITFTLAHEPQGNRLVGSGHAGCNRWTANVVLREDLIDVTNIVTTRKMCPKPQMRSEQAFLTSLKSAHRWRVDEKGRLIVEGEAARLLLTADGTDRQPDKKPAKNSGRKSAEQPANK